MHIVELAQQQERSVPDATLVAYFEKAFPVYCLALRVQVTENTSIGLLPRFLLRLIGEKIEEEHSLAEFLGLSAEEVRSGLRQLQSFGYIFPFRTLTGYIYKLSDYGKEALETNAFIQSRQEIFHLKLDAVSGRLYHPNQLDSRPLTTDDVEPEDVVRPFVPNPSAEHMRELFAQVQKVYKQEERGDLEGILEVVQVYTQYRMLRVLVFQTKDSSFIFRVFDRNYYAPEYEEPLRQMVESGFELWIDGKEEVEEKTDDWLDDIVEHIPSLELSHQVLEQQGAGGTIQFLTTTQHFYKMQEAFMEAKQEIIIISPWVTEEVITELEPFVQAFINRGGIFRVGYGYPQDDPKKRKKTEQTIARMKRVLRSERFDPVYLGDTHEKLLICDEEYLIIGSYNWLSFRGDPKRSFRAERSIVIREHAAVVAEKARMLERFARKRG